MGIATYAVAPDCLFLFHDIGTSRLSILQAKGRFKELLPRSGSAFIQPSLTRHTTWAELPHIAYEDLLRIQIAPPKKLAADELALQNDLVVKMQDLYSGAADPGSVKEILEDEDNLKSIVIAETARGNGRLCLRWLGEREKPLLELVRPDVDERTQHLIIELIKILKIRNTGNDIDELRNNLRVAHKMEREILQWLVRNHKTKQRSTAKGNRLVRKAMDTYDKMEHEHSEKRSRYTVRAMLTERSSEPEDSSGNNQNGDGEYNVSLRDRQTDDIEVQPLFIPGFDVYPGKVDSKFVGSCMLCLPRIDFSNLVEDSSKHRYN